MAGPVYVEDTDIARTLAGLSDSFSGKGGAYIANVRSEIAAREDQRRKLQLEMQRMQEQQAAQQAAIAAETARQRALPGPKSLQTAWATSGGPIGTEEVPAGGPAPLRALPGASEVPAADAAAARDFELQRNKDLATYSLGVRFPEQMGTIAKAVPEMAGQSRVAQEGVAPVGSPRWQQTQTMLEGKQPTATTMGEKAAGNFVEVDGAGNQLPGGASGMLDANGRDIATGAMPVPRAGGRIVKAGEAKLGGGWDEPAMRARVFDLAKRALRPGGLSAEEEADLKYTSRFVFPWAQDVTKNAQGQFVIISKQKEEQPQLLTDALTKLEQGGTAPTSGGNVFATGAAPFQQTPGAGPQTAPLAGQETPGGGVSGPGFKVSAPFGPSEASPEALRKEASSTTLAANAMSEFYKKFGYSGRGPNGEPGTFTDPKAVAKNVPSLMSTAVTQLGGDNVLAERAAKTLDPKAQEYNALAYRFVEPVIRLASGAAISPREYSQYFKMFVPNANDSPLTASQKLDAMKDWVDAVAGATTARGALDRMDALAKNPIAREAVNAMREAATRAKTLDTPVPAASPGSAPAPGATAPAPTAGETKSIGGKNYRRDPASGKWFEVQ